MTNDPRQPIIKVTVSANVKPLPGYVNRISTANVTHGEEIGAFQVWPTARPAISVEPGERIAIALRIKPRAPDAGELKIGPGAPESWKLRREASGDYWLDIPIEGGASSSRTATLIETVAGVPPRQLSVQLNVGVPEANLVVAPSELDFGEVSLSGPPRAPRRVSVRKLVGSFSVKSVSSTLPFVKFELVTIVEGNNYLLRVSVIPTKSQKAGAHNGILAIETADGRLAVPIKVKFVNP